MPFHTDWVLYQDADILVVNKPSGLLSVPGKDSDPQANLVAQLAIHYPDILTIHRLDMDTSGVMVFARNKAAQSHLSRQFQERQTQKRYQAVCFGHPAQTEGIIQLPMRCDWENRPLQMIDFKQGKHACTHWKKLSQSNNHCRLELTPVTGRSHQLRLHLKMLGHPILGDNLYADTRSLAQAQRLLLHATCLTLQHPSNQTPMTFHCEPNF